MTIDRTTRQMFGVGFTQLTASYQGLRHILADGSNGDWRLACSTTWIPQQELVPISSYEASVPTCLACIAGDMAWWAKLRGCVKRAQSKYVNTMPNARRKRFT